MDIGVTSLPIGLLKPTAAAPSAEASATEKMSRAKIDKTARDFEASFLSIMLGQMFEGVETAAPFGGGDSEKAFRSFLTESMGKSMAQHGGIGLADSVRKEMLKLQGLT